jgi:DNA-binding CsgD family transcriptional regulator
MIDDVSEFSELVASLYDAAGNASAWSSIAGKIADAFDVASCSITARASPSSEASVLSSTENMSEKFLTEYSQHYHKKDDYFTRAAQRPLNIISGNDDLISDRELEQGEIYVDWLRHMSVHYLIGSVFSIDRSGGVGSIGVHREKSGGLFDTRAKAHLASLLPHLQRALALHARLTGLELAQAASLDALGRLGLGVIVVAVDGRILYASPVAEASLRRGTALRQSEHKLRTTDHRRQGALDRAIRAAALTHSGAALSGHGAASNGTFALSQPDAPALSVFVSPLPEQFQHRAAGCAAVFIAEGDEAPRTLASALSALYGLTPAEARLAAALSGGESLNGVAERLGVSTNTVRTQLKAVFQKTGHTRQAELVRAITANPVLRLHGPPG